MVQCRGQLLSNVIKSIVGISAAYLGFASNIEPVCADAPEAPAEKALPPIQTVTFGPNNEFLVNGKPFIPIAVWLQKPDMLPKLKALGINTDAG